MDKRYQVFVSSTFTDLKEERKAIIEGLLNAKYIPAGMEMFSASNDEQFKYIKKIIDTCDYYVLIVGARYGTVNLSTGKSFTEQEYDYAVEKNIPVLAFLHDDPYNLPVDKRDDMKYELMERFRTKVSKGRLCKMWHTSTELVTSVIISLTEEINNNPQMGWTRGKKQNSSVCLDKLKKLEIDNKELRSETQKLKDENRRLQCINKELSKNNQKLEAFIEDLKHENKILSCQIENFKKEIKEISKEKLPDNFMIIKGTKEEIEDKFNGKYYKRQAIKVEYVLPWDTLFLYADLQYRWISFDDEEFEEKLKERINIELKGKVYFSTIDHDIILKIKEKFLEDGLIEVVKPPEFIQITYGYDEENIKYKLSQKGEKYLNKLKSLENY